MLDLARVAARGQADQHALHTPYRSVAQHRFAFRFGQLGMIVAGPGTGKSALALDWLIKAKVPALYISPDTDAQTMLERSLSNLTGLSQQYVQTVLTTRGAGEWMDRLDGELSHIRWSFDSFDMDDVEADVAAFQVVFGEYPQAIVVDNLANVARGGASDLEAQRDALDRLHLMAQVTGAAVIVLHHATGEYDNGDRPIPLSGLANKVSKLPAQILTLHRKDSAMYVCVVKNRTGPADPSGGLQGGIRADMDTQRLVDWQ